MQNMKATGENQLICHKLYKKIEALEFGHNKVNFVNNEENFGCYFFLLSSYLLLSDIRTKLFQVLLFLVYMCFVIGKSKATQGEGKHTRRSGGTHVCP